MRHLAALLSILTLTACGASSGPDDGARAQKPPVDVPVEFLLTSAASDFHAHPPPYPVRFRDVRVGEMPATDGGRLHMLCGQFSSADGKGEWIPFVTIKTSGYEQYVGDQAADFCKRSSRVSAVGDLSSALQSRLDAMK